MYGLFSASFHRPLFAQIGYQLFWKEAPYFGQLSGGAFGNSFRLGAGQSVPDRWINRVDRADIGLIQIDDCPGSRVPSPERLQLSALTASKLALKGIDKHSPEILCRTLWRHVLFPIGAAPADS